MYFFVCTTCIVCIESPRTPMPELLAGHMLT